MMLLAGFYKHQMANKHEQYAAEKRGGTVKAPHLFVQSLRSFLHKKPLHFVCPCRGRYVLERVRCRQNKN
ncbi:hypothetical protein FHR99_000138 [Litorivivens lipolytica]|uniref:Uncharacterized protein n=1 Tax=Litorivivens lipolytica TaxID=1524264 RepID=A0A7W4Z4C1_9GAMM|nr:hypothetical protein [Litorivivens lipolytica]